MIALERHPARTPPALATTPYDRWVTPEGEVKAEFHRMSTGYLLRFMGEADFEIDLDRGVAAGWPAPDTRLDHFDSLFNHAVVPLVGNHSGGLFLHGSAVALEGCAIAFLGLSRSGKTTLAGAFAKSGYPFLTEDVIELKRAEGAYLLQPKQSHLRVFGDSAAYLFGAVFAGTEDDDDKHSLAGGTALPFSAVPAPLVRIYLLGEDHGAALAITPLEGQAALGQLLPHAFVLDVEDKARLGGHFCRIAELSQMVACQALDYPRQYAELPRVIAAIVADLDCNRTRT
jgi:hypothetical protein